MKKIALQNLKVKTFRKDKLSSNGEFFLKKGLLSPNTNVGISVSVSK